MAISQLLQKSEELTDWLRSTLNNSEIEFQHRTFMAYACLLRIDTLNRKLLENQ